MCKMLYNFDFKKTIQFFSLALFCIRTIVARPSPPPHTSLPVHRLSHNFRHKCDEEFLRSSKICISFSISYKSHSLSLCILLHRNGVFLFYIYFVVVIVSSAFLQISATYAHNTQTDCETLPIQTYIENANAWRYKSNGPATHTQCVRRPNKIETTLLLSILLFPFSFALGLSLSISLNSQSHQHYR